VAPRTTIDELLELARARLDRLTPPEALDAQRAGAVLVDVRPRAQRDRDGTIPGAVVYERNVLEWRLDPASDGYDRELGADLETRLVVVCDEGYQSSLAAATLQDLGFTRATDVVGGFQGWRAAGLPVSEGD
jgi:rhodanese-related sulfurtransferase